MTTAEPAAPSPTAVMVPGLGLDARSWAAVRARLREPGLVVTLPALGHRARRGTDLHVEHLTERLLAALPPTGDVLLVGHSAGCPVVVDAALREPRVTGLVLVGPVTDPRAFSWPRMLTRWAGAAAHEHLWEVPLLAPQYRATGAASMVRGMSRIRHYRTAEALSRLTVPSVVIRGQRDRIASQRWCDEVARSARAEVVSVPRAAHMVPLTHPSVVADVIERLRADRAGAASTRMPGPPSETDRRPAGRRVLTKGG